MMTKISNSLFCILFSALFCTAGVAFGSEPLGSEQVVDLDAHPNNPGVWFASTTSGVYQSVDAGFNWDRLPSPGRVTELAIDPNVPFRMFAATSEFGLHRTLDGGQTWQKLDLGLGGIERFTMVAVAPDGSVTAGVMNGSLFASRDAGSSWQAVAVASDTPPEAAATTMSTTLSVEITSLQQGTSISAGRNPRFDVVVRNTGSETAVDTSVDIDWVRQLDGNGGEEPNNLNVSTDQGSCDSSGLCRLGDLQPGQEWALSVRGATRDVPTAIYRLYANAEAVNAAPVSAVAEILAVASAFGGSGAGAPGQLLLGVLALFLMARIARKRVREGK